MSTSYIGKLARINLSTGEIKIEQLDLDLAKNLSVAVVSAQKCSMMRALQL